MIRYSEPPLEPTAAAKPVEVYFKSPSEVRRITENPPNLPPAGWVARVASFYLEALHNQRPITALAKIMSVQCLSELKIKRGVVAHSNDNRTFRVTKVRLYPINSKKTQATITFQTQSRYYPMSVVAEATTHGWRIIKVEVGPH
ncbi:MAG: Rv3235 family protein [Candidatus Nanopelagicales bacterium]